MTELLFRAVVHPEDPVGGIPQSEQSELWWKSFFQLSEEDNPYTSDTAPPDFSDDGSILYTSGTNNPDEVATRDITLSEEVDYLFGLPNVNVEYSQKELINEYEIEDPNDAPSNGAVQRLVTDVADTIVQESLFVEIEDVALQDERSEFPAEFRQATGPFTIEAVADNAFAPNVEEGETPNVFSDGYWVAIDTAALPSFEGITIDYGGSFNFNNLLDGEDPNDPELGLEEEIIPIYKAIQDSGVVFPQEVTLNLTFDLNKITDDDNGDDDNGDDDVLRGTNQRDLISVDDDDGYTLIGLSNNDNLRGGNGKDILNGTGEDFVGTGEIDILRGGNDRDVFVLGEGSTPYYLGGGHSDYAIIEDFTREEDLLQLGSDPDNFEVNGDFTIAGRKGAGILFDDDLVAILVEVDAVDLVLEDLVI